MRQDKANNAGQRPRAAEPGVPHFSRKDAAHLATSVYGVDGRADAMPSYADQNFLIETASQEKFVLKIANRSEKVAILEAQNRAMATVAAAMNPGCCPQVRAAAPGHAIEMAKEADFERYGGVVAAGGDGTLFEVVNGYFQNTSQNRIPLGVLPVGTGNAFARDLGLDAWHWQKALDIIHGNETKKVDVGRFRTQGKDYYYLNILGVGLVARITKLEHRLKLFGNFSYTFSTILQMLFLKSYILNIEIDGEIFERENIFVEISNTRYTSNFLIAPDAKNDDGLLDVILLGKCARRRLLRNFPKIFTGKHTTLDEIETYQAKNIRITTNNAQYLTPDGELLGKTPGEIECLPQAIEVFWR